MNTSTLREIAAAWQREARLLSKRGAITQGELMAALASELSEGIDAWESEVLTIREAAEESGLSYSTLQQYLARDVLPNAGEPGSPRIRRKDLPNRGARRPVKGPDVAGELLLRGLE